MDPLHETQLAKLDKPAHSSSTPSDQGKPPMSDVEFSAALNAWYATMLERDKSVLALSSAGIAACLAAAITLASSEAIGSAYWGFPFVFSAVCFIRAFKLSIDVFRDNAEHLRLVTESKIKSKDESKKNAVKASSNSLSNMKDEAIRFLMAGVITLILMGGVAAYDHLGSKNQEAQTSKNNGGKK